MISLHIIMIVIQLCRGDWEKESSRIWAGFTYTVNIELHYAMRNIISLAPDPRDSARSPTKGLATQAMAPAITSLAAKRGVASWPSAI